MIKVHMLRGQSSWANCQSAGVGGVAGPAAQMESCILQWLRFSIFISLRVLDDSSLQPSRRPFRLPMPNSQYAGCIFDKSIIRPE